MRRAICFDMDGVIVDSELHWRDVSSEFLAELIPSWGEGEQRSILGKSVTEVHVILQSHYGLELSFDEFLQRYQGLSARIYGSYCNLLPGVEEALERFQELPLALVTSAPRSWMKLVCERFSLEEYFSVCVAAEDVEQKGKPLPDCYLLAARRLQIEPEYCVAIEDSAKGVRSARAAKMKCIGLRNGFNSQQDLSEADVEVESFESITPQLLARL